MSSLLVAQIKKSAIPVSFGDGRKYSLLLLLLPAHPASETGGQTPMQIGVRAPLMARTPQNFDEWEWHSRFEIQPSLLRFGTGCRRMGYASAEALSAGAVRRGVG